MGDSTLVTDGGNYTSSYFHLVNISFNMDIVPIKAPGYLVYY